MLIIGAKGFAMEVLEVLHQDGDLKNLTFYDDINQNIGSKLYNIFPILKSIEQADQYLNTIDNRFTLGLGDPQLRYKIFKKFTELGGNLSSTISAYAKLGNYGNHIQTGVNIMTNVIITNNIQIGKGCLINLNATIGHDSILESFVEICPGVNISGNCVIGAFTFIGTNATILPHVKIGRNVVIGANSLVNKDIPDNCVVIGSPAEVIKSRPSFEFQL